MRKTVPGSGAEHTLRAICSRHKHIIDLQSLENKPQFCKEPGTES